MDSKEFDQLLDEVSEQLDRISAQLNQKDSAAQVTDSYIPSSASQCSQRQVSTR